MDTRLIAFDLEGVLVDGPSSWTEVHKGLGTLKHAEVHAEKYLSGEITFDEWAEADTGLWQGVDAERINEIVHKIPLMVGATQTIPKLKEKYILVIISGGLQMLADRVKNQFGMDYAIANELVVEDGVVRGIRHMVDFESKGYILRGIAHENDISIRECAAIGDYTNDIPLFKAAGFSIAFNPRSYDILEYVDEIIYKKDLRELLRFF